MERSPLRELGCGLFVADESCAQFGLCSCFHVVFGTRGLMDLFHHFRKRHENILGDQSVQAVAEGNEMAEPCRCIVTLDLVGSACAIFSVQF